MPQKKIIQTGAEAVIIQKGKTIIKKRIKKSYRIPEIDEKIRRLRTRSEGKILQKVYSIINVPKVIKVNEKEKEIVLEFINGKKLSENLDNFKLQKQKEICEIIGKNIAELHNSNIIHEDLTTSNMIFVEDLGPKVFFIDFGLSFISSKIEDKAVDLHLIKQALEAKHFKNWQTLFESILIGYENCKEQKKVLEQLKKVEQRGRYKEKY